MSKKKIVLADNSYTIRRIVELSFAEEEDIEIVSFETGFNLKEKLVELVPEVVLVDIKLPEFNGYEVCKFINQSEAFRKTRVFLMKGGFEPVDESLLKGLNYVDIVTKPFDSNALVASIKKVLEEIPGKTPVSVPEDISSFPEGMPEIDSFENPEEEINFADIKDAIQSDEIIAGGSDLGAEKYIRDEVLPSEEITVGAQPEKDSLKPENHDEMENPFADDMSIKVEEGDNLAQEELKIKEHIKEQEKELNIGSLTQEEMNIKEYLEKREKEPEMATLEGIEGDQLVDDETSERFGAKDKLSDETLAVEDAPEFGLEDSVKERRFGPVAGAAEEPPAPTTAEKIPEMDKKIQTPPPVPDLVTPPSPAEEEFPEEIEMTGGLDEGMEMEMPGKKVKPEMTAPASLEELLKRGKAERVEPAEVPGDFELEEKIPGKVESEEEAPGSPEEIPPAQKDELTKKIEDKLTLAVKEILWEIAPPLAEKIIKEEIEKIKSEIDRAKE